MKNDLGDIRGVGLSPETNTEWYPDLVSWNVGNSCNLRCPHCYLSAGERGPAELSFEEGCRLIDQLASAGSRMLILTGGEPLMHRDITELARYASSRGLLVVLGTNGMLLTSKRVGQLREAGVAGAGISLDSLQPEWHDSFRGVPGAWKGAVRGIRECVAQGLPVLLQMTALPWNYQEIPDMVEFAYREGVTGFTLYFLVCTGRGEQLSDITPRQYEEALASLVEAQQLYPQMMVRARCAPQIARMASQQGSPLVGNAGCLAARHYCRITPEGNVTPCPYLPLVGGSIRERPFADIWDNSPAFRRLRQEAPGGKCGICDFREMCGGCRARAFALTGELTAEDPWCDYQPVAFVSHQSASPPQWTHEAEERLQRVQPFIRSRVKMAVERHAQASGKAEITPAEMTATLEGMGRRIPFKRPPGAEQTREPG
ncbi:MAG: radical SAM protein [Chloroflexi bacterium]|nr:radical SAM protein [Chloroflexota bacterium]